MNVEAAVLKLILENKDDSTLEWFSQLKPCYFSNTFSPIYASMASFYENKGRVPTLNELKLVNNRSLRLTTALNALALVDISDLDIDIAVDTIIDNYTQSVTLDLISEFLDNITILSTDEILKSIDRLPLTLSDKVDKTTSVVVSSDINVFNREGESLTESIYTGISNEWDAKFGGFFREDLILIGGMRGSGKSVTLLNLAAQQVKNGYVVPFFTIEMSKEETNNRYMSILSGVPYDNIKRNNLSSEQSEKIARARAQQYIDGMQHYASFFSEIVEPSLTDYLDFESSLAGLEPTVNRLVIIDDRDLSITTVDSVVSQLVSRYGDLIGMVCLDYINKLQTAIASQVQDVLDWKNQMQTSTLLKKLARKHGVCLVSPYQMTDEGKARFSQGILDECDVALLMHNHKDHNAGKLSLEITKARGHSDDHTVTMEIDWPCLRINPAEARLSMKVKDDYEGEDIPPTTVVKMELP